MKLRSKLLGVFKLGGQISHLLVTVKQTKATDVAMVPVHGCSMAGVDISGMHMPLNGAANGTKVILWAAS